MKREEECAVCGSRIGAAAAIGPLSDRRKGLAGSWELRPCGSCHTLAMSPLPSEEELERYYASYALDERVDLSRRWTSDYPRLRKAFHWLSGDVDPRDFVRVPKEGRVLDYGCGHAGYLREFHERGVAITGAEIARFVVDACRQAGLDVRQVSSTARMPFSDAEFDVVYLMQVFEHLRDPRGFLKEIGRILRPGGSIYLALPNSASIWRRVFGRNWISGWFPPFHLFHYDQQSMARLAERHGFKVVDTWSRTPASWFRLNLKAFIHAKDNRLDWRTSWLDNRLVVLVTMIFLRLLEVPFSNRDCMMVHLRHGEDR